MEALTVLLAEPGQVRLSRRLLRDSGPDDLLVEVHHSGISTGTERLLYTGRMPWFPGLAYPLVPGYESVGEVLEAPANSSFAKGDWVFVPGGDCYADTAALFGGASSHILTSHKRVVRVGRALGPDGVLLALAATALHALKSIPGRAPEVVVGHGVLGRLIARLAIALGGAAPTVWETRAERQDGAQGYRAIHPDHDDRNDYTSICDASGDPDALDRFVSRLARGGLLTLAGFYDQPLRIDFAPAFQRELRLQIAAEWEQADLEEAAEMVADGRLSLSGLVTHQASVHSVIPAYRRAFEDPACLKMVIDWHGYKPMETSHA